MHAVHSTAAKAAGAAQCFICGIQFQVQLHMLQETHM